MSLEDDRERMSSPEEGRPAGDRDGSVVALADEAVPLRDPAADELERERAERVRVVVGRGPRVFPRLPRRATSVIALALAAALGLVAFALAATGGGGHGGARDARRPTGAVRRVSAPRPSVPAQAHARSPRRRATTDADGAVARRRPHLARRHRGRHRARRQDGGRRHGTGARKPSVTEAASEDGDAVETPPPTTPEPVVEPTAAEPAPEPAPEPTPAPEPEPEPAPEPSPPPAEATSPPPRAPAEAEFNFER